MDNVGEYLKKLRGEKSLGQVEIMTGITKSYLSKVERGERGVPSPKVLEKLAKAYNVDYDDLLAKVGYADLDPELLTIRRAAKKMNPEQKQKMMEIFKKSFSEFFPEEDE